MSKKTNRRHVIKKVRAALKRNLEFFSKISGRALNSFAWNSGVGDANIRERSKDE